MCYPPPPPISCASLISLLDFQKKFWLPQGNPAQEFPILTVKHYMEYAYR